MIAFNYIDRQKSAIGTSEKSQKVHSANWKEEVYLRKELESLKKQENETISRIFSDQRLVAHQFRRRISRSIDLIKSHEKLKADVKHQKKNKSGVNQNSIITKFSERPGSVRSTTSSQGAERLADSVTGYNQRQKSTSTFRRPVTASETSGRLWERRIRLMTSNLQRAKSAPTFRITVNQTVEELHNRQRSKATAFSRGGASTFSINREHWNKNRIAEVAKQREAVLKFAKRIQHSQMENRINLGYSTEKGTSDDDPEKK